MYRRTYVRSLAVGASAVAGCLAGGGGGGDDGGGNDLSTGPGEELEVRTSYPQFAPATYSVTGRAVEDPADEPVPFADLPRPARIEVANGVARDRYLTADSPAVLDDDRHQSPIEYDGAVVSVSVAVSDRFGQPELGPDGDPDWREPLAFEATVDGDGFGLALRNELDEPLAVHHHGRPYFGVLTAVGDEAVHLDHEAYRENEFVETGEQPDGSASPRTGRVRPSDRQTETLAPGEALGESYALPADVPDDAIVWLSIPVGDETVDVLGNRRTVVAAAISLAA